jgi:hypothetical protein
MTRWCASPALRTAPGAALAAIDLLHDAPVRLLTGGSAGLCSGRYRLLIGGSAQAGADANLNMASRVHIGRVTDRSCPLTPQPAPQHGMIAGWSTV